MQCFKWLIITRDTEIFRILASQDGILFSILDANVDASLFNYDVSTNLNLTLFPVQMALPGGFTGAGVSVGLKITFKLII
jgi:hypothetical protein